MERAAIRADMREAVQKVEKASPPHIGLVFFTWLRAV